MTREELLTAIQAWDEAAGRIMLALADRQYRDFVAADRDGRKLFQDIKVYIKQLDGAAMEAGLKDLVMAAMDRWLEAAKAAEQWKEDIRCEIDTIRRRRRSGRAIGKMYYGHGSPSGKNLQIKAK